MATNFAFFLRSSWSFLVASQTSNGIKSFFSFLRCALQLFHFFVSASLMGSVSLGMLVLRTACRWARRRQRHRRFELVATSGFGLAAVVDHGGLREQRRLVEDVRRRRRLAREVLDRRAGDRCDRLVGLELLRRHRREGAARVP